VSRGAKNWLLASLDQSLRIDTGYPTLRKEREGWGTRRFVAGIEPKKHRNSLAPERKAVEGLRPSFSAHVRWCEQGTRVDP
jgi:hypothetical protein